MINTLLMDADGVIQSSSEGFVSDIAALCPDPTLRKDFLAEVFRAEKPCLTGECEFPQALERVLEKWKVAVPVSQALHLWHQVRPVPAVLDVIADLRRNGLRVCLATNQQAHRAGIMANTLGYRALFDELFFSCDIGMAKPDPGCFVEVLARLREDADNTLFIDDHAQNVASAESIGIAAAVFHLDDGVKALTSILRQYELVSG